MLKLNRKTIALIAISCSANFQTTARAIDAVFIPSASPFGSFTNDKIEVQGFNGRFDLPITVQGPVQTSAYFGYSVSGATATDSVLYTLLNSRTPSAPSIISESDAHTGAYLGTIQLSSQFSDIACTNGQLYGVQAIGPSNSQSLQIASISTNGTVQPILTQNSSLFSPTTARLSGVVGGDSLLISPTFIFGSSNAEVFIPSSPSTPPSGFNLPTGIISGTVIHADGAAVTTVGEQTDYTYPGATLIGPRSINNFYGQGISGPISDEFDYTYTSSQPAYVSLAGSPNNNFLGASDGLYRLPQTLSTTETMSLNNGVTPDGTTINNVVARNLFQQTQGAPLPITIQETDAPPGPFTSRQIAQATVTINLAGVPRGFFGVGTNSNITADYTTGSTTQTGQPVSVPRADFAEFAYDPVSANLVGNGDGSLFAFGWETTDSKTGNISHAFGAGSDLGLGLIANPGDPQLLTQFLQLPTANSPMQFSFSYDDLAGDPGDLTVLLNGVDVGDVTVSSHTASTFQTTINNPSLENLTNANLTFEVTDTGTDGGAAWVGLGSISLTAVPEPASASVLGLVAMTILTRRRRRRN